jgi:hypothetical protein
MEGGIAVAVIAEIVRPFEEGEWRREFFRNRRGGAQGRKPRPQEFPKGFPHPGIRRPRAMLPPDLPEEFFHVVSGAQGKYRQWALGAGEEGDGWMSFRGDGGECADRGSEKKYLGGFSAPGHLTMHRVRGDLKKRVGMEGIHPATHVVIH